MALSDFTPDTKDIIFRGKTLCTVRGLNLNDLGLIVRNHIDDLRRLYDVFDPSGKLLPENMDVNSMLFSLLTTSPDTAAKIIALASDEPHSVDKARQLSAPLQMRILIEVVKLTFEDVGGPLEFGAILRKTLASVPNAPTSAMIQ